MFLNVCRSCLSTVWFILEKNRLPAKNAESGSHKKPASTLTFFAIGLAPLASR